MICNDKVDNILDSIIPNPNDGVEMYKIMLVFIVLLTFMLGVIVGYSISYAI